MLAVRALGVREQRQVVEQGVPVRQAGELVGERPVAPQHSAADLAHGVGKPRDSQRDRQRGCDRHLVADLAQVS